MWRLSATRLALRRLPRAAPQTSSRPRLQQCPRYAWQCSQLPCCSNPLLPLGSLDPHTGSDLAVLEHASSEAASSSASTDHTPNNAACFPFMLQTPLQISNWRGIHCASFIVDISTLGCEVSIDLTVGHSATEGRDRSKAATHPFIEDRHAALGTLYSVVQRATHE